MINGVDMLFVVIGFLLLLFIIILWERYIDWCEWDRNRRRQRKLHRYDFQDVFGEIEYRAYLQTLISPGLISAMHKMSYSFEKMGQALRGY